MFLHRSNVVRNPLSSIFIVVRGIKRKRPPPGKPPCLPPSKTKRYRVIHVPWEKPEVVQELLWRRIIYFDALNSIRAVIKEEYKEETKHEGVSDEEIDELTKLLQENVMENERMFKLRVEKQATEISSRKSSLQDFMDAKFTKEGEKNHNLELKVTEMIERSKDFITAENMEEKLVLALENVAVYDWAMDRQGNVYVDETPESLNNTPPSLQSDRKFMSNKSAPLTCTDKLSPVPPIYQPINYEPPTKTTLV